MNTIQPNLVAATGAPRASAIAAQGPEAFAAALDRATGAPAGEHASARASERKRSEREQGAQEAAEQLVATTFVLPILAQMHEAPFATGPFAPGAGERRMSPLFDQHLADRIVKHGRFPLVDAVRDHILGRGIQA